MFKFHCDINPEEDSQLLQAIQTILDAFSSYKGKLKKTECERDHFKALLKSLQNSMSVSTEAPSTPLTPERRKRKKFAAYDVMMNVSEANVSADLNNAAFLLSSTCGDEEDVIGPTQFTQTSSPLRVNVDRTVMTRKPVVNNNKENREQFQTSPNRSGLSAKPTVKCETGAISARKNLFEKMVEADELNESKGSEPLLVTWISKKPASAAATFESNMSMAKKKNRLSLGKSQNHSPKLRQATINFQATSNKLPNDDETYCDDFATFNQTGDESPANVSIVSPQDSVRNAMAQIKIEKPSPPSMRSKKSSSGSDTEKSQIRPKSEPNTASTSTVIIVEDAVNEIITLEDTQSTWSSFENILDDQNDTEKSFLSKLPKKLGAYEPGDKTTALKFVQSGKGEDVSCPDCDKYNNVVRAAMGDKDVHIMNDKCIRHRNDNICPATPPNFWNPRIPDTPEGEHLETPFDYRFIND